MPGTRDAGELDQRITIETPTAEEDELGQENLVWTPLATVWAKAIETPGREFLKGDYKAEAKAVFQIRWREVATTARVLWRGRAWRIESATGTQRSGFRSLQCVTIEPAGAS